MSSYAPSLPKTQRSIQWTNPGKPAEVLSLNDSAPVPTVSGSDILVKVHAAALNPVDWKLMRGGIVPRLLMPKIKVPGMDVAGTVVGVGPKASDRFQVGDKVMAMLSFAQSGALTEYTIVEASLVVKTPERWSFEQAAAWPLVATTVWKALVDYGHIKSGDKVLVNGASGGTDGKVLANAVKTLDQVAKADPVIDSVNEFTMPAVLAAFDKSQSGRAKGKIVIKIA
ncbi:NADPh quinone reductase [Mortierella alpina]|nr:NADPh quinone reductase [Mortierella alpina]